MGNTKNISTLLVTIFIIVPVLVLGIFLRFFWIGGTTYEVDEVVNWQVPEMINTVGFPTIKPEAGEPYHLYTFHPPILYYVLAGWFRLVGSSILSARILNAAFSIVAMVMLFFFMLKSNGRKAAVLLFFFVMTDGWIVMTNRMNYLENGQMIAIVAAMWAYWWATKSTGESLRRYALAGALFGLVLCLKVIGGYIFLAVLIAFVLSRGKHLKGHCVLFTSAALVFLAYTGIMYANFGQMYLEQAFLVHFKRIVGTRESRGMNFGVMEILQVIVERYWIYGMTVLALLAGGLLVAGYFLKNLRQREFENIVWYSWGLSGLLVAALSSLKSPHYLMLWVIPLYAVISIKGAQWAKGVRLAYVPVLLLVVLGFNLFTWNTRFISHRGDAVRDSAAFIAESLPADAVVVTEPYIGFLIPQGYVREYRSDVDENYLKRVFVEKGVDYLAVYTSSTVRVSDSELLTRLVETCHNPINFKGFKDNVMVCKIDPQTFAEMKMEVEKQPKSERSVYRPYFY